MFPKLFFNEEIDVILDKQDPSYIKQGLTYK